jgi:Zinc knuckle
MSQASGDQDQPIVVAGMSLMREIPTFSGKVGDGIKIRQFLDKINEVGILSNWTEAQKCTVARLKLQDQALLFKNTTQEVKTTNSWARFRELMLKRFTVIVHPAYRIHKYMNCKQRPNEDVLEYSSRMRSLGLKTIDLEDDPVRVQMNIDILDEGMKDLFMVGLQDSIRRFTMSRNPDNFQEAVDFAMEEMMYDAMNKPNKVDNFGINTINLQNKNSTDKVFNSSDSEPENTNVSYQKNKSHNDLSYKSRPVQKNQNFHRHNNPPINYSQDNRPQNYNVARFRENERKPRPTDNENIQPRNYDRNSFKCNKCGRFGHLEQYCRVQPENKIETRSCFNCLRPGHLSRACTLPRQQQNYPPRDNNYRTLPAQNYERRRNVSPRFAPNDEQMNYNQSQNVEQNRYNQASNSPQVHPNFMNLTEIPQPAKL